MNTLYVHDVVTVCLPPPGASTVLNSSHVLYDRFRKHYQRTWLSLKFQLLFTRGSIFEVQRVNHPNLQYATFPGFRDY
jgi:hypothetical protein